MAGSFFDSFNAALIDLEASFSEDIVVNGLTFPAIAIEEMNDSTVRMTGGTLDESTITIFVRDDIILQAGIKEDVVITARGKDFLVWSIKSQGDAAKELTCGPIQIDVWGKQ